MFDLVLCDDRVKSIYDLPHLIDAEVDTQIYSF